eukprot:4399871-Pleurochrysis_carterae.AAC.6
MRPRIGREGGVIRIKVEKVWSRPTCSIGVRACATRRRGAPRFRPCTRRPRTCARRHLPFNFFAFGETFPPFLS